jgi:hypothetical protein
MSARAKPDSDERKRARDRSLDRGPAVRFSSRRNAQAYFLSLIRMRISSLLQYSSGLYMA